MPSSATLNVLDSVDLRGLVPAVDAELPDNGGWGTVPFATVLTIEQVAGPVPGKAVLRQDFDWDRKGPQTLNRGGDERPYGMRIKIYKPGNTSEDNSGTNDEVLFLGQIMGKHDMGQKDEVQWIIHDDREVLSNLFVRGALVADSTSAPIMNRRFTARFNPNGLWNCTSVAITGMSNQSRPAFNMDEAPVFAPYASLGRAYESPVDGYTPQDLEAGKVIPWTARLALTYLCNLANIPATKDDGGSKISAIDGIQPTAWRSLSPSKRLMWDYNDIVSMVGIDPSFPENPDMLDRKLPDLDIRGLSFNLAIQKILDAAGGTHSWCVRPVGGDDPNTMYMSKVTFFPVGVSAFTGVLTDSNPSGIDLKLQRGGMIKSADTIWDFNCDEDASNIKPCVLVEGAPVRVETMLEFDPTDDKGLLRAWTAIEEMYFLCIVLGTNFDDAPERGYAKVPPVVGDTTTAFAEWETCDGGQRSDGTYRPFAYAKTPEAVALARQYYPTVFIAFRINPDDPAVIDALKGVAVDSKPVFDDTHLYPQMKHNRQILTEQLGYMLQDLSGDEKPVNFMLKKFPIRVMVKKTGDTSYVDLVPTPQVTTTGDGIIWLHGLAEELDGEQINASSWRSLYSGSLYSNEVTKIVSNKLRINLAMPMDHRVLGWAKDDIESNLQKSFCDDIGGPPILYVDNPNESFNEPHQVESSPTNTAKMSVGSTNLAMPLNRFAPPGSERVFAREHAERRLMYSKKTEKRTSWRLPYIRSEFPVGTWVNKIKVFGADEAYETDVDYVINAAIRQVTFDFMAQETTLSGLEGSL